MAVLTPTIYNTGNPVPSDEATDLDDNARVFDVVTNDQSGEQVKLRTGKLSDTLDGRLARIGYVANIPYAAGISFTTADNVKTIARPDDETPTTSIIYAPYSNQLPFVTTGVWGELGSGDDKDKFYSTQGVAPEEVEGIITEFSPKLFSVAFSDVAQMVLGVTVDGITIDHADNRIYDVSGVTFETNTTEGIQIAVGIFAKATTDVNFIIFGADPLGIAPSDVAVIEAFEHASLAKVGVNQGYGLFLMSGSNDVNIKVNCDLNGSQFDLNGFSGKFVINRDEVVTEYLAGSAVINAIESSSRLTAGTARFDGLDGTQRELEGCFILMDIDQDFYTYRSVVQKRKEFNTVYNLGVLSSPVKYSLVSQTITKVTSIKISGTKMKVKGLSFLETDVTLAPGGIVVLAQDVTRLEIDMSFITGEASQIANIERFRANRCSHLRVNGIYTDLPIKNVSGTYGYTFGLYDCYDVICDSIKSDGWGWGVHGDGESQKVTISNSTLSRVDSHRPFREYLKVINSQVGNWGMTVVGVGDLILDNVDFVQRDARNFDQIIVSRLDGGGFIDGKLIMNNVRIIGDDGTAIPPLLECVTSDQQFLPTGSPINGAFFTDVRISGLSYPSVRTLGPLITCTNADIRRLKFPRNIVVKDVDTLSGDFNGTVDAIAILSFDTTNFTRDGQTITDARTGNLTNKITLSNINMGYIAFTGENELLKLDVRSSDCSGDVRFKSTNIQLSQQGRYEFTNPRISSIFTGPAVTTDICAFINGGALNPNGVDTADVLTDMNGSYLEIRNSDVIYRNATQLANVTTDAVQKQTNLIDKT